MYYEDIFVTLRKNDVRYAVAGGVAMVLHGIVRFTADLDLIVDLERGNLQRFLRTVGDLGYRPRNPVQAADLLEPSIRERWKHEKGMVVFSFINPALPMALIDMFIDEKIPFAEIEGKLERIESKGVSIPIVSLQHLKVLKRSAGRPQDLADIEAIEAIEQQEGLR